MSRENDVSNLNVDQYAKAEKKRVTICLDQEVVDYFKNLAVEISLPYQSLINAYLADCVKSKAIYWKGKASS